MDPNENLKEQIKVAIKIINSEIPEEMDALLLAELVIALDEWITKGGECPTLWQSNINRNFIAG